jgi:hypothetical protein
MTNFVANAQARGYTHPINQPRRTSLPPFPFHNLTPEGIKSFLHLTLNITLLALRIPITQSLEGKIDGALDALVNLICAHLPAPSAEKNDQG